MILRWQDYLKRIEKMLESYSSLFFLESKYLGLFLAFITLFHFNIGIMGLLGLFITMIYLSLLNIPLSSPLYSASLLNGMLSGLFLGDLYLVEPKSLLLLAIWMILNIVLTAATATIFKGFTLPILSIPFSLSAICLGLLQSKLEFLVDARVYFVEVFRLSDFPSSILYFFKSIGSLFCTPDSLVGALLWFITLLYSPLTGIFLILGFFLGTMFESFLSFGNPLNYRYVEGFNYSLIFTAFTGYFLFPSILSLIIASIAVLIAATILNAGEILMAPLHLQVMSIPFNLVTILGLLALKALKPFSLSISFFRKPEINLERSRLLWQRHRYGEIGIFLPVTGHWKVQQGFNGGLTHKGLWQHAIDLVCVDNQGRCFLNQGLELHEHFTFGQEVYSPIAGTVLTCLDSEEDNPIGRLNNTRNWGNYIILRAPTGVCVVLAHLQQHSVNVKPGDMVNVDKPLAKVGNSGYSQEPHLHIQVQWSAEVGAITTPFHFLNYVCDDQFVFHAVPEQGQILSTQNLNQAVEQALNFKVDHAMTFKVTTEGSSRTELIQLRTQVDGLTGAFHLQDGISRLNFAKAGQQFYFYGLEGNHHSPLWDLYAVAPRIPMIYQKRIRFKDSMPAEFYGNPFTRLMINLKQIILGALPSAEGHYEISEQGLEIRGTCTVSGKLKKTYMKIDPHEGVQSFSIGEKSYERVS